MHKPFYVGAYMVVMLELYLPLLDIIQVKKQIKFYGSMMVAFQCFVILNSSRNPECNKKKFSSIHGKIQF